MKRTSAAGGNPAGRAVGPSLVAAPLPFPSADGPGPSGQGLRRLEAPPAARAVGAWVPTPALIGLSFVLALFALAAFAILQQSALGSRGDAAGRWHAAGWTALAALGVAALAGWLLGRRLNRPVQLLSDRAVAVALRYSGQMPARGRNAMRNLEVSLEAMNAALLAHCDRLESLHLEELQTSLELQRRYALMRVLRNVSTAALECERLEQVLERAVEELGGYLDWPIGRVLIVGEAGRGAAAERSVWFVAESERFASFIAESESQGAEHGAHGLIGLAGSTGMPHWVTDLGRLKQWPRQDVAARSGLKTGFVIPIAGDGSTHAFLEFFSDHRVEAAPEMLELIESIHIGLWQAGQWRRDRLRSAPAKRYEGCGSPDAVATSEAGVRA
jgi:hypothetical protein